MTIDISAQAEARLKARADAAGVPVGSYLERLLVEEDARRTQLAAFAQAIDERMRWLDRGESVDGEKVMGRLVAEFDEPNQVRSTR